MPVAIRGTAGGSVTLSSGAAASDTTLTLPNTTGTVALTASPTFSGTLTATTITSPASTALTIQSAGTTAMTVDTSQNVGIGTSSPSQKLHVNNGSILSSNYYGLATASTFGTTTTAVTVYGSTGSAGITSALLFSTNSSERMRIDSTGYLFLNTTTGSNRFNIGWVPSGETAIVMKSTNETYNGQAILFQNSSGGTSGYINQQTSSVSYNTSSDYRIKENVAPLSSGLTTIGELKPVTYNWKIDGAAGEGFLAHELQEVIPLAVSGEKDAVNEDGSIKPQGVDYSKIVVHLVAACQELSAKNDALEARLAALEAK
jgi:hypothetical protein